MLKIFVRKKIKILVKKTYSIRILFYSHDVVSSHKTIIMYTVT